jgi:excisionase family DNA binding protein
MLLMEELLTTEEVAHMLKMKEYTIREMLKNGVLRGFKLGGQWRIRPEALRDYVKSQEDHQTK